MTPYGYPLGLKPALSPARHGLWREADGAHAFTRAWGPVTFKAFTGGYGGPAHEQRGYRRVGLTALSGRAKESPLSGGLVAETATL